MGFKLVRVDNVEPCKILLDLGTNIMGRNLQSCNDPRISKKHCQVLVAGDDNIVLTALHKNPTFFKKKDLDKLIILQTNEEVTLSNGDRIGLLPDSHWFEIINCVGSDSQPKDGDTNSVVNGHRSPVYKDTQNIDNDTQSANEDSPIGTEPNEVMVKDGGPNESVDSEALALTYSPDQSHNEDKSPSEAVSPVDSMLADNDTKSPVIETNPTVAEAESREAESKSPDAETKSPNAVVETQSEEASSSKRVHPEVKQEKEDVDVKKVKKEEKDSGDDAGPSDGIPAPVNNNVPPRERCIYADKCYRRNPQHLAQYSHPRDADWGGPGLAPCPWGARCRRREPRHRDVHHHPAPPPRHHRDSPRNKPRKRTTSDDEDSGNNSPDADLIVTGKRKRTKLVTEGLTDSEDDDPYGTDGSDEWAPGDTTSQDTGDF